MPAFRIQKKPSVFYEQLLSHSNITCKEGHTKTYIYSFIFHVDCNYTKTKEEEIVLPQLHLFECAAMRQTGDGFV